MGDPFGDVALKHEVTVVVVLLVVADTQPDGSMNAGFPTPEQSLTPMYCIWVAPPPVHTHCVEYTPYETQPGAYDVSYAQPFETGHTAGALHPRCTRPSDAGTYAPATHFIWDVPVQVELRFMTSTRNGPLQSAPEKTV